MTASHWHSIRFDLPQKSLHKKPPEICSKVKKKKKKKSKKNPINSDWPVWVSTSCRLLLPPLFLPAFPPSTDRPSSSRPISRAFKSHSCLVLSVSTTAEKKDRNGVKMKRGRDDGGDVPVSSIFQTRPVHFFFYWLRLLLRHLVVKAPCWATEQTGRTYRFTEETRKHSQAVHMRHGS